MGKVKKQLDNIDLDKLVLRRQLAIIGSMTLFERRNPKVLNASRKRSGSPRAPGPRCRRSTGCSRCICRWPT